MAFRDGALGNAPERSERSRDPIVGSVINGKFHVHKAIARGGMGRIYYGTQAPLDRPVALKIVKADSINEDESQFLKRFLLEASILAKLQHPNVVTLFDYGRIEGAPVEMYFIAMEYLDGQTMSERLRTRGALPTIEALVLFRQIARGLREAHARGVVHRDLKPSNIIVVPEADGEIVKLVDFGIGKIERGGEDLTRDGVLVGTPKYMAPEQFEGASSPASDVYALGIIAYQMLTGTLPFGGNTMAELMIAKLQHPIPAIRDANPVCDASDAVENLVYRMLTRRPEERPSLDEVFAHLAACEDELFGTSGARLALSSSGARAHLGSSISSRPHSIGALQVPYTIVAPASIATGPTPRPHIATLPSQVAPTGMTPRPMATPTYPPPTAAHSSIPVSVVVALVIALCATGVVGMWFATARLRANDATETATSTSLPTTSVAAPEVPASFMLRIDSTPSGAEVFESGSSLGVTPIELSIERASVTNAVRTFEIKKDGFSPTSFTQGSSSEARVERVVQLAPEPARTVAKPVHPAGGRGPSGGSKAPPSNAQGDLDIRLKR